MAESTYIPEGRLSPYVKFIWYCDSYTPPARKERVLPAGSTQLILNLGAEHFRHFEGTDHEQLQEYDHTVIVGVHSGFVFLDAFTRISTMGVVFRPGGIQAFFGLPADEFKNQVIFLGDVTNSDIPALRQQLIEAATPREKFNELESFLIGLLDMEFRANPAVIFAVQRLQEHNGTQPIANIIEKTGYSRRRLSELFSNGTGITPKGYARIRRFQYSLELIRKSRAPDWSRIALNCGYYDQAHFNHDFHKLSGLTPSEYFRHQTGDSNHLHV